MSDDTLDRLKKSFADHYSIEREIDRGGMAVVYLAEDLKHLRDRLQRERSLPVEEAIRIACEVPPPSTTPLWVASPTPESPWEALPT